MTRPYADHGGLPKPPPDIWDELSAAGATNDQPRIDAAAAKYRAWLIEHGHLAPELGWATTYERRDDT